MVESAIKSLYAHLVNSDLAIAVYLDQATTHVDALQMSQVLSNLLTNAINAVLKNKLTHNYHQELDSSSRSVKNYDKAWPPKTDWLQVDGHRYAIYGAQDAEGRNSYDTIWISGFYGKNDDYSLVIKDKGVGIATEHLVKIFDPFFSIDSKGHGLGLSIAQSLCLQNNVNLAVESSLGQGTTFILHFYISK